MSWCDKLNSVPTVGIKLSPKLLSLDKVIEAIGPLLDDQVREFRQGYDIDQTSVNAVVFNLDSGFSYTVEDQRISVTFSHRMGVRNTSGGLPTLAFLSEVRPYSELVDECRRRLIDLVGRLPEAGGREIRRTGVVTNTFAKLDDVPPGLRKFVSHFQSPWGAVPAISVNVTGILNDEEKYTDKCTHALAIAENAEQVPQFSFDWMRQFKGAMPVVHSDLDRVLRQSQEAALSYYEFLGEVGIDEAQHS